MRSHYGPTSSDARLAHRGGLRAREPERRPHVSVVVPMYGCALCLDELHRRLVANLSEIAETFEIVLVNDASPDDTWRRIEELAARDPRVKGLNLARNFGQHYAIAAGLENASGDWVVVMDCDLQNPPEDIPRLYARAQQGYDAVFGRRVDRKDAFHKVFPAKMFGLLYGYLTDTKADPRVCNFSVVSRRVVDSYCLYGERNRAYVPNIIWLGYSVDFVDVGHATRHAGETTYTLGRQIRFALDNVVSQSNKPLRVSMNFGFLIALGALLYGFYLTMRYLLYAIPVAGWTSVMVSLYFLMGTLFANIGIVGLYLGEVFSEVKGRPLYLIKDFTASWDEPLAAEAADDRVELARRASDEVRVEAE